MEGPHEQGQELRVALAVSQQEHGAPGLPAPELNSTKNLNEPGRGRDHSQANTWTAAGDTQGRAPSQPAPACLLPEAVTAHI